MKRLGLFLTLMGLLTITVWGLRLGFILQDAYKNLVKLQAVAQTPDLSRFREACSYIESLNQDLKAIEREAGLLLNLIPKLEDHLKAMPLLFQMAQNLSEAGVEVCHAFKDLETVSPESLLPAIISTPNRWEKAFNSLQQAEMALAQTSELSLHPSLERKLQLMRKFLPLGKISLNFLKVLPDLLGADGQKVYLILAQNENELRPTGGFITGVGEIHVQNGRLISMTFRDSYAVDDFSLPYPDPPEPLRRYMGIDLWVFRDSNWSPDFPTSARNAISLYRPGYPLKIDGVIAVDQEAVSRIVKAIGPLKLEGEEELITGENVIFYMRKAWAPEGGNITGEWWLKRKNFMASLAEAILKKVEDNDIDWISLARSILSLLKEKHILIYLQHPEASSILSSLGWDGSLKPTDGDFLMVVDSNLGYNKVNPRVRESISYEVDLTHDIPRAILTLIYTHTAPAGYPCQPEARYDPIYEKMMDRCYWDYIRIYIPYGSKLQEATRIPIPPESLWHREGESGEVALYEAEEGPWTVMAVMSLLPPSTTQTRFFVYSLPLEVIKWEDNEGFYHLKVQKQPGTLGHPLMVKVSLPPEAELISVEPEPSAVKGGTVLFQTILKEDKGFSLRFRRKK